MGARRLGPYRAHLLLIMTFYRGFPIRELGNHDKRSVLVHADSSRKPRAAANVPQLL